MKTVRIFVALTLMLSLGAIFTTSALAATGSSGTETPACQPGWYSCGTVDAPMCCSGKGCPSYVCGDAKTVCEKYSGGDTIIWGKWLGLPNPYPGVACASVLWCKGENSGTWSIDGTCPACCALCESTP